jgi:cobyrinic acid a,c-diamide synthase
VGKPKIGVLDVRGAMPYYEPLPFNYIIDSPGLIKNMDMVILPPGSLMESRVLERYGWIRGELWEFAERGGAIVGTCSGLQLLSRRLNLSTRYPAYIDGLGILDVIVEPLVATGPVNVRITGESWVTEGLVGTTITGWQAHTYGKLMIGPEAQVVGESDLARFNYRFQRASLPTLIVSRKLNVFGTMVHGILGPSSPIVVNIAEKLDLGDIREYYRDTWGIPGDGEPRLVTVVSTMSGEGKTLITTAIVHCLSRRGFKVGVAKLGGDVRDLHPSLYMLRKQFMPWMSIKLNWGEEGLGWLWPHEALRNLPRLDYLIIEGVMGLLTGSSRDEENRPASTWGFIRGVETMVVLVISPTHDGIEGALERVRSHVELLSRIGRKPTLVVLNRYYGGEKEWGAVERASVELNIRIKALGKLGMSSKPEEEMDLGEYAEAAEEISESICDALTEGHEG